MTLRSKTFSCLAILSLPLVSEAAIVARYDFEASSPAAATRNSTDTDPDSTAGPLTPSSLLDPQSARSSTSFNHFFVRTVVTSNSKEDALTQGSFFSFDVTPAVGTPLSLSNLTFLSASTASSSFAFTGHIFVRSSVDNFATDLAEFTKESTSATTAGSYVNRSVDLSGSQFQDLTGAVTFRLYFWDDSSTPTSENTGVVHRIDDIIVNSVPEPTSVDC
jgi:hypothetical protein